MRAIFANFRNGLRLPPSGWALAAMLTFYVVAGLFGRDPWKGEDAIHIGTTWHMLAHNDWLAPNLAGRIFDEPPLYYWSAALLGKLLGWAMPLHDAIRLASGIWVALALIAIYYAGRELYGKDHAAASPLLLAGCGGLVVNAHEAQPLLIALAAYCASLASVAAAKRRPQASPLFYGASLAACLLGTGFAPTLPILLLAPLVALAKRGEENSLRVWLQGWLFFLFLALPWPIALGILEPHRLHGWLLSEAAQLNSGVFALSTLATYLGRLPAIAFPTFFIAAWALWIKRSHWREPGIFLPLMLLGLTLSMLLIAYRPKELPALLMLPPLALLATPGAMALRRGAASALDWFSAMSFTFFAALTWIGWLALTQGWPEKMARRALLLRPGFVGQIEISAVLLALAGTLAWFWLIFTLPRSPYRSLVRWSLGLTTVWLLASLLWLPWFDYGRSYRPVAQAVAKQLPTNPGCIAEQEIGDPERASLAYFIGIEPLPYRASTTCHWLLVKTRGTPKLDAGWIKVWEGNRPGERKERIQLYHRPAS